MKKFDYFAGNTYKLSLKTFCRFMKNILFICASFQLLSSCASLTKSQIEMVNQFAKTSKNFSSYPSEIVIAMAELRVKRGIYYANSLESPVDINLGGADSGETDSDLIDSLKELSVKQHIEELNAIYNAQKRDYRISTKLDITFKVIDKYAQALLLLSSDKYATDLVEQATNFGISLDSLISTYNSIPDVKQLPNGIGGFIGSLILAGGKLSLRSKQANDIKRFVPAADPMIDIMTTNLLAFLQSGSLDMLIKNEDQGIQSNYKSFLRQNKPDIQNEKDYLEMLAFLDHIKTLRDQTVSATKNLRQAHSKLVSSINEKRTLTDVIAEIQTLNEDVNNIKSSIRQLQTAKN